MNDRSEQSRVGIVCALYRSISVQLHQLDSNPASLRIFSSRRVDLRIGLQDSTFDRMRFGERNGFLSQCDAPQNARRFIRLRSAGEVRAVAD
jgi:hypothetical protein